jgi:hypothetical protein
MQKSFSMEYPNLLNNFFHFGLLFYWGGLFVRYAVDYYQKCQGQRALRESQLEASLARAQIQFQITNYELRNKDNPKSKI